MSNKNVKNYTESKIRNLKDEMYYQLLRDVIRNYAYVLDSHVKESNNLELVLYKYLVPLADQEDNIKQFVKQIFNRETTEEQRRNAYFSFIYFLRERGVDPFVDDNIHLIWAVTNNHYELAKYLLDIGANPTARYSDALSIASENANLEMVKLLCEKTANPSHHNCKSIRRAAHCASLFASHPKVEKYYDILRFLVTKVDSIRDDVVHLLSNIYIPNRYKEIFGAINVTKKPETVKK